MESSKVKNIILTILVVTNILLLGLMLFQRVESRHYRQQALQDAVDLLAQQGISAQAEAMPDKDFPVPQVLETDAQRELESFSGILGSDTTFTQRGLVSLYSGSLGTAEVWENGSFTVQLTPGAYPLVGRAVEEHALSVLDQMGFSGQITDVTSSSLTAVELLGNVPIFSCAVTLSYEGDELRSISGTHLTGTPSADSQAGEALSTATLLVRFRSGVMDSGDTCTAILSAAQGYVLSADAAQRLRRIPVLRLETDTNLYLLNALTGEWSRM